ncbi:MAG TPA: DUF4157 domain-containing protein [Longimicrobium sp.]|nr:DUF4157 domain-containing protein [Longimicrobium sp.]
MMRLARSPEPGGDAARAPLRAPRPPAPAGRPGTAFLQRQLGNRAFALQRCSCGGSCPGCRAKNEEQPPLQTKLTVGAAGDAYERQADQVAEQVMRMPAPGSVESTAAPSVQRQGDEEESELQAQPLVSGITPLAPGGVQRAGDDDDERELVQAKSAGGDPHAGREAPFEARDILQSPGEPLDAGTRSFMEPRFGAGFGGVRIHTGASADVAARSVGARAYTVGNHVVFGAGQYTPGNDAGKRLLAHELTHVVQQGGAAESRGAVQRLQRAPAVDHCVGEPKDKWIKKVTVNQETPQTATVEWSDGTTESDQCSSGKGHCCTETANGVACTETQSRLDGTNCTPITKGRLITGKTYDHGGVYYWSEFDHDRAIALHKYSPVDGTPLSHGCVRLNEPMAKKIFCASRVNATKVEVRGFARPKCSDSNLQKEWLADFELAGTDIKDGDKSETAREVREARREMESAFGAKHTPEQYRALTAADIPRCKATATIPAPGGTSPGAPGAPGAPAAPNAPATAPANQSATAESASSEAAK